MILKVFGALVGVSILLVFGVIAFFPAIQAQVVSLNTSIPISGNYSSLNSMIRFTPLALVIGVLATPVAVILIYKWAQNKTS